MRWDLIDGVSRQMPNQKKREWGGGGWVGKRKQKKSIISWCLLSCYRGWNIIIWWRLLAFFHCLHVELFCASVTELCCRRCSTELFAFSTAKKVVGSEQFCKLNKVHWWYVYIVIVIFYMHINITNIVCTILFTRKKAKNLMY